MIIKYLKRTSIFMLSVVILFLAINLPSQELNPDAARILAGNDKKIIVQNNAYFPFLGMFSKTNNIADTGLIIYESLNTNKSIERDIEFKLSGLNGTCFRDLTVDCREYIAENKTKISTGAKDNKILLDRYRSIINRYTYFKEYVGIDNIDWSKDILKVHRLFLYDLLIDKRNKNLSNILSVLLNDIKFWRSVLSNSTSILSKIVSIAVLDRDIKSFSRVLLVCDTCKNIPSIERLSNQELDFKSVVNDEFRYIAKSSKLAYENEIENRNGEDVMLPLISNRGAVLNEMYAMYQDLGKTLSYNKLDINLYSKSILKRYSSENMYWSEDMFWWVNLFYNPVGKVYAAIALPEYSGYKRVGLELDFLIANLKNIKEIRLGALAETGKRSKINSINKLTKSIFLFIQNYDERDKKGSLKVSGYLNDLADITNDQYYKDKAIYWQSL